MFFLVVGSETAINKGPEKVETTVRRRRVLCAGLVGRVGGAPAERGGVQGAGGGRGLHRGTGDGVDGVPKE